VHLRLELVDVAFGWAALAAGPEERACCWLLSTNKSSDELNGTLTETEGGAVAAGLVRAGRLALALCLTAVVACWRKVQQDESGADGRSQGQNPYPLNFFS
jgi:hypothetical protein